MYVLARGLVLSRDFVRVQSLWVQVRGWDSSEQLQSSAEIRADRIPARCNSRRESNVRKRAHVWSEMTSAAQEALPLFR